LATAHVSVQKCKLASTTFCESSKYLQRISFFPKTFNILLIFLENGQNDLFKVLCKSLVFFSPPKTSQTVSSSDFFFFLEALYTFRKRIEKVLTIGIAFFVA
jgi:hypothetical protein